MGNGRCVENGGGAGYGVGVEDSLQPARKNSTGATLRTRTTHLMRSPPMVTAELSLSQKDANVFQQSRLLAQLLAAFNKLEAKLVRHHRGLI